MRLVCLKVYIENRLEKNLRLLLLVFLFSNSYLYTGIGKNCSVVSQWATLLKMSLEFIQYPLVTTPQSNSIPPAPDPRHMTPGT